LIPSILFDFGQMKKQMMMNHHHVSTKFLMCVSVLHSVGPFVSNEWFSARAS